jgi:YegS/Rv2252/BmrU family lipid kinase
MTKKNKAIRAKLIVNLGAGVTSDANSNLNMVTGYLEKNGLKVDIAYARPKEEATPIAKQAVKNGYKIVIAMGGDGTIEAVMRGMIGGKARLGILPTGTENNIAKSLGVPQDLQEACALIVTDNTLKLDMGQVTTRKGKKFVFFEMATIGLSAAIYPDVSKAISGKLSSIKASALTFIRHETRPSVFLTLDNESKIEVETMLVVVSNTPVFGKNFMVAPDASMQDGRLDVSVYPDFSKIELLRYYAAVMDGGYSGDGKVQHYQARKIKIKTSPKLDVMADGVALGRGTVTIKVRPAALRVITTGKSPDIAPQQRDDIVTTPITELPTAQTMIPEAVTLKIEKNHHTKSVVLPG